MKSKGINPAAARALFEGDLDNFLVAATPGGIEAQERRGQQAFVQSSQLPKDGCDRAQMAALGIQIGEDIDDLFVSAVFPEGWRLQATDHSMHSNLLDNQGRKRAGVFYKAAFYDRSANMRLLRFISITRDYENEDTTAAMVQDATGAVLFCSERVGKRDWKELDRIEAEAEAWALANYPDYRDPLAYWA